MKEHTKNLLRHFNSHGGLYRSVEDQYIWTHSKDQFLKKFKNEVSSNNLYNFNWGFQLGFFVSKFMNLIKYSSKYRRYYYSESINTKFTNLKYPW